MPAQPLPEHPSFVSDAERVVWEALRDQLPTGSLLLANVRLRTEEFDHEADLVALVPEVGVVVLEVKGGSCFFDPGAADAGSGWFQGSRTERHPIEPFEQARRVTYALRDYVQSDPRWGGRGRLRWSFGVALAWSEVPSDVTAPDSPRWALHDRTDLATIGDRVVAQAERGPAGGVPSHEEIALVSEILRGRGFTGHDPNAEAEERRSVADRLTDEQAMVLQVTRLLHRVEVRGGAGSGKTVLALAQARNLARGREDRRAQRVALLCYSIGLAQFLKREVDTWPRNHRPAFVGTFEELANLWGVTSGTREDSDFWENRMPAQMAELALELPLGHRFDAFVVDEAQDFADSWWVPLLRAMREEETGGLYVFSDENQRIFARYGQPPVPLVPLVLDHNLRNTRQIHQAFSPLAPTRMAARGTHGPDVIFLDTEDPMDLAEDCVEELLGAGWRPGNVALLTTGSRHPVQLELTEHRGQVGYWKSFYDDEVFYGHVLGCKGLERPAVVLCVNDDKVRDRAREKLYVGMSRATDQLIVVGDRAVVAETAGPQVAHRLGI